LPALVWGQTIWKVVAGNIQRPDKESPPMPAGPSV
jgi:hypothetical protein